MNVFYGAKTKYNKLLPKIREVANRNGYAIGVHGSEKRDFDLIAVPWISKPVKPKTLAYRIANEISGFIVKETNPTIKPHGREAWAIHVGGHFYIDLSIFKGITCEKIILKN